MSLSVLVADDELLARKRLSRLLSAMPDVKLAGECESAEQVLSALRVEKPDALLLDIDMPGMSGIEALQLIPEDGPTVVFCTAHAEHAVSAFEHGAVDYLLKPVEPHRLRRALDRAAARVSSPGRKTSRLALSTQRGVVLIDPETITHALLDDEELVTVHTATERFLTDLSLQSLEEKLPKDRFERVHRRALLNLLSVQRLEPLPSGGYLARTHAGAVVEVSRQAARQLRRRLGLRKAIDDDER